MSQKNVRAPQLPSPPVEYDARYMNLLLQALRLYFNQLDNVGPVSVATQNVNGTIVAGLSFVQPNPSVPNTFTVSLPTQADLSNLRSGDVYYDTTANNVLKVKP